ncbi:MAG: hypothetical protein M3O34_03485 [Chloroflexota bacterium]|nr:hypothetical protein [Chloroflexota bacterium]
MLRFLFGVLVGFGVKMAYDFVQEERIPADLGMAQGRSEAILDETRQLVRELRDEVRRALGSVGGGGAGGGANQGGRGSARRGAEASAASRES